MRCIPWLACVALFAGSVARSQEPAEDTPLEEVVVTGEFPGPGMWKVTRAGDAGNHVLWIVGDPPPLPKRMKWKSKDIEATALTAQEILRDSAVSMQPDEKIGFFRGMSLLPAMLEARRNPDDAKLKDLLPAELYARWLVQKRLYLGRESGVESWRPLFAADKLRKAAFDDLKLREGGAVWDVIGKLAEKHKIKVTSPQLRFTIKRSEVRAKIKEFSRESLADVECFDTMLRLTEALGDRETQNARAHAWATGDHEGLARLPALPSPYLPCAMAVMTSQVAREVIPPDIREKVHALWLEAAERSLAANQTTFAIAPFVKLTRADGYLAMLRAKGYLIEAPQ
ncbi:MAG TPA: TraB/GumN family protein [Steroidobacteraceae bacterium]|nr:TraB/GumN family protein [Steroidobacteraceae bacterium]